MGESGIGECIDLKGETDGDGNDRGRGAAGDIIRDGLESCGVGDNVDPLTSALCADVSRIGVVLLSRLFSDGPLLLEVFVPSWSAATDLLLRRLLWLLLLL